MIQLTFDSIDQLQEFLQRVSVDCVVFSPDWEKTGSLETPVEIAAPKVEKTCSPSCGETEKPQDKPQEKPKPEKEPRDWDGAIATISDVAESPTSTSVPPPTPSVLPTAAPAAGDAKQMRSMMARAVQATNITTVVDTLHKLTGVHRTDDVPPEKYGEVIAVFETMIADAQTKQAQTSPAARVIDEY